jgi:excisionase family DNA binding protein
VNLDELMASRAAVVTVAQAASVLGVDVRTVSRAVQVGELPVLRLGRRILIPRLRLLELLGITEALGAPEGERTAHLAGLNGKPNQAATDKSAVRARGQDVGRLAGTRSPMP